MSLYYRLLLSDCAILTLITIPTGSYCLLYLSLRYYDYCVVKYSILFGLCSTLGGYMLLSWTMLSYNYIRLSNSCLLEALGVLLVYCSAVI